MIIYAAAMDNTITAVFEWLLAFSAKGFITLFCGGFCLLRSCIFLDVLKRSAFQAVCAVLYRRLSVSCWFGIPTRQSHGYTVLQRFPFHGKYALISEHRDNRPLCLWKAPLYRQAAVSTMAELCPVVQPSQNTFLFGISNTNTVQGKQP